MSVSARPQSYQLIPAQVARDITQDEILTIVLCITVPELQSLINAVFYYNQRIYDPIAYTVLLNGLNQYLADIQPDCLPDTSTGLCSRFGTTSSAYSIFPNDPYSPEEEPDISFFQARWYTFTQFLERGSWNVAELAADALLSAGGYFDDDLVVLTGFETQNPFTDFGAWLSQFTNYTPPHIKIDLVGSGRFEIELLNFPLGGYALIVPNLSSPLDTIGNIFQSFIDSSVDLPSGWLFFETNRAIGETSATFIQTINFDTDSEHTVHVFWLPRVDATRPPFLFVTGGWREFSACGNLAVRGFDSDIIFDRSNFKQSVRSGAINVTTDYETLFRAVCDGVICASEEVASRILAGQSENVRNEFTIELDPETGGFKGVFEQATGDPQAPEGDFSKEEILWGQAISVEQGFNSFHNDVWDFVADPALTDPDTTQRLQAIYDVEDDLSAMITAVRDYQTANSTALIPDFFLRGVVRCSGPSKQTIGDYLVREVTPATLASVMLVVLSALNESQVKTWWEAGVTNPSFGFESAPCYTYPSSEIQYTAANFAARDLISFGIDYEGGSFRKFRMTYTGLLTNSIDGTFHDGIYLFDPSDNSRTVHPVLPEPLRLGFNLQEGTTNFQYSPPTRQPVAMTFQYEDYGPTSRIILQGARASGSTPNFANFDEGSLTITIVDLGTRDEIESIS